MEVRNVSIRTMILIWPIVAHPLFSLASILYEKNQICSGFAIHHGENCLCHFWPEKIVLLYLQKFVKINSKFTEGFHNWNKTSKKLSRHSKSQMHRETLANALVRRKTSSKIYCQLVQANALESKYWHEKLRHVVDVMDLVTTWGLALHEHDRIVGLFHNGIFLGII